MFLSSQTLKFKISNLPKSPGVYEFCDKQKKILYIGKATSLRDRVGSYFRNYKSLSSSPFAKGRESSSPPLKKGELEGDFRIESMVSQIANIRVHETDSVLEALILEANLIKKHQPKYNVEGKDDKSFAYVVIMREKFPRILIVRETELQKFPISNFQFPKKSQISKPKIPNTKYKIPYTKTYGPYTSKKQLEIALKLIRKIFPYHSTKQISRSCCFEHQIGLCPGPYAGAILRKDYLKNIHGIEMILKGKKKKLLTELQKQMKEYSKNKEYEKAAEARNRIFALRHIRDVALISNEKNIPDTKYQIPDTRIEAYDISNIGGDFATGSMVVFAGNKPDKSQYRKFKIRTVAGIDDVAMMREVLVRRFNNNWQKPDLILLDGGKGHLNMGEQLLKELKLKIPVVAVAKGPTRKISNFKFQISNQFQMSKNQQLKNIIDNKILLANIMGEAHRFAVSYHKKLRRKNWREK